MTPGERPSPELLLGHVGWIKDLARQLVADRDLAEDLAQDACVAALEHGPLDALRPRAWLAGVLRNLLRQRLRGEGRRQDRERATARTEAEEPTARTVERIHLQRELAGQVLELDEPYRTAVLLRFFEELPPREISRRLGVPVSTVQSRLSRGLARLRERLDREQGFARPGWAALLAPLGERMDGFPWTPLGGLLMNVKLVTACALVAAGAALALARGSSAPAEVAEPPAPAAGLALDRSRLERDEREGLEVLEVAAPERRSLLSAEPAPGPAPAVAPVSTVRGRVLDAEARPVAGVLVRARTHEGEGVEARTGPGGGFELETPARSLVIHVAEEPWVTVRAGEWTRGARFDPVVVVAPGVEYGGRVVDAAGRPLAGARLSLVPPRDLPMRFGEVLDGSSNRSWSTSSGSDGRFLLAGSPALAGASLACVLDGYVAEVRPLPPYADPGILFELAIPAAPLEGALRGRVVHADGAPAPGARVGIGLTSALADEQGLFELDLSRAVTADELVAVAPGALPARIARPEAPSDVSTGWPEFVEVRLGGPALSLSGLVVDHEGRPKAGVLVWLDEPTKFGVIDRFPATVEGLMAGAPVPAQAHRVKPPETDSDDFFDYYTAWSNVGASPLWNPVRTDAEGRFELPGLLDRSYRLHVMEEDSTLIQTTDAFPAGRAGIVVRLPRPDVVTARGRVVLDDGSPLANVEVTEWVPVADVTSRIYGGTTQIVMTQPGRTVATDAEGRFEIRDVPRHGVRLHVSSDRILPAGFDLDEFSAPSSLELEVEGRCHLQVILDEDPGRVDAIALQDAGGAPLDVMVLAGGSTNAYTSVPVVGGRSEVVSVSSRARTLLLLLGSEVVESIPIHPRPDEPTVVRR